MSCISEKETSRTYGNKIIKELGKNLIKPNHNDKIIGLNDKTESSDEFSSLT